MNVHAPISAATALHSILVRVVESSAKNTFHRWGQVVGDRPDGQEFPKAHVEYVRLLQQVSVDIQELPEREKARAERYFPRWWDALVRCRVDWATEEGAVIAEHDLDALAFVGSLVETHRGSSLPSEEQWDQLGLTVERLLEEVHNDSELPKHIREQIAADLDHVLWLINNVDVYGVDRVVRATEETAGRIATASLSTGVTKLRNWFAVCMIAVNAFTGFVVSVDQAIESGISLYERVYGIEQAEDGDRDQIIVIVSPPRELTPASDTERSDEDDVVDAEVVDESSS